MTQQIILNATKARQNFFELLEMIEKGKEAIIVKKNKKVRFRVSLLPVEKKINQEKLLDKIAEAGLPAMSWSKMKKIIIKSHDIRLDNLS